MFPQKHACDFLGSPVTTCKSKKLSRTACMDLIQGRLQTAKRSSRNVTRGADTSDRGISRRQNHQNVANLCKILFILIALQSRPCKKTLCLHSVQQSIFLDTRMIRLTWKNMITSPFPFLPSSPGIQSCTLMSLLQKNHAVLLKCLWKRTCAVNKTLDFFHQPSTLQSQTDIFNFRLLLYTVEVTATQNLKFKSIQHPWKPPIECKPLIDTSYHIQQRLELKYFHFAQFLLNAHQAAHRPRKSENW